MKVVLRGMMLGFILGGVALTLVSLPGPILDDQSTVEVAEGESSFACGITLDCLRL